MSPKIRGGRQRKIALKACDTCKRRKQRCDGSERCDSCVTRETTSTYNASESRDANNSSILGPPSKRHQAGMTSDRCAQEKLAGSKKGKKGGAAKLQIPKSINLLQEAKSLEYDEDTDAYGQARMLEDRTGDLVYFGGSATCSYLQLIRLVVESSAGPSPFTKDPSRHKTTERALTKPEMVGNSHMLPVKKVADVLMELFYANGFVEVVIRQEFKTKLDSCYSDPTSATSPDLCLIYLVLSIGLAMAAPSPNSPEYETITHIRGQDIDRAETFFQFGKKLGDDSFGFENGGICSIQAMCLMSMYTLVVSRRNAAYSFLGMAVRSAYSMGLHKTSETGVIFEEDELARRRSLWRSLFILDHFLAMSLGRPTSISEEDYSHDSLEAPNVTLSNSKPLRQQQNINIHGLNAGVQASRAIGMTLKQIYSKKKVLARAAQEIGDCCNDWAFKLDPMFDADNLHNPSAMQTHGLPILQVQLLGHHSIILLSRPFFLCQLVKAQKSELPVDLQNSAMAKFSEACFNSCMHTIKLCQIVYESQRFPQRNPFVIYFLYSAALIVLSNEFGGLHSNADYPDSVSHAINMMAYCASADSQADHFLSTLLSFQDVIQSRVRCRAPEAVMEVAPYTQHPRNFSPVSSKDTYSSPLSAYPGSDKFENSSPISEESIPLKPNMSEARPPPIRNPLENLCFGLGRELSALEMDRAAAENQKYASVFTMDFSNQQSQSQGTPVPWQADQALRGSNSRGTRKAPRRTPSVPTMGPMCSSRIGEMGMSYSGYPIPGIPGLSLAQPCGVVNSVNSATAGF